jgi:aspartyl protease family protein
LLGVRQYVPAALTGAGPDVRRMLKYALLFAGAGMATVLLSPVLLPMLQRATETPPSEAVSAASPTPVEVVKSAPSPRNHELQIPDNGHGQYIVNAWVNGVSVRFLVDTGANIVSISTETANRLGFMDSASAPHYEVGTANGHTRAYGVKLRTVDLGPIYVGDVDATVSPGLGSMNLLGENFLHRLVAVEQRDGLLILRQ